MGTTFKALIKQFTKKQLVSLDSEIEIKLRTTDISIIPALNELAQADKQVKITIEKVTQNDVFEA